MRSRPLRPSRLLYLAGLLLLAGCASEPVTFRPSDHVLLAQARARELVPRILGGASEFELLSLDPRSYRSTEEPPPDEAPRLLGYTILGATPLRDPATVQQLSAALLQGVRESEGYSALCFSPRHALRFRTGGGVVVFLICFECSKVQVAGDPRLELFRTTGKEEPLFDAVLRAAGIPKAP